MTQTPDLVLENRFAVPPRFVKAWLTDYREDDGRFFGDPNPFRVRRAGHVIHREQDNAMGRIAMTVDVAADDHWTVEGDQRGKDGGVMFAFRIVERVRAEGAGTLHRVELSIDPAPPLAAMLPQMVEGWRASLEAGFRAIAEDIALAARAGKAPTA